MTNHYTIYRARVKVLERLKELERHAGRIRRYFIRRRIERLANDEYLSKLYIQCG